jgi:leader peptidase (prepilin peptidase)/N-methyltransferase
MHIVIATVLAWLAALCWFDLRERRLPNSLTLGGAAVTLAARFGFGGIDSLVYGFAGAAAAGAFLLIPFLTRGAGGGDVKMLFACGAIAGWDGLISMLWVMSLAGIAMGLLLILAGRLDVQRLRHYTQCAFNWNYDRVAGAAALAPKENERVRMPFSLPIAVGLVASLLA